MLELLVRRWWLITLRGALAGLVIAIATFAIVWGVSLILLGLRLHSLGTSSERTKPHEHAKLGE